MAKVQAQVVGGQIKQLDTDTVGSIKQILGAPNHAAAVNGNPADDGYRLRDYEFVSLSSTVKSG